MRDSDLTITTVPGIRVGHATDLDGLTGCTVVLCEKGAVGGVDQRGGAPGTRETDLLRPMHMVDQVNAVLLAGGSAFGLAAADGVMRYLEEQGAGFNARVARVPIVPAAILFDLDLGDPTARPDADMGYVACQAASADPVPEGNVGAGTGATVGKILGPKRAMKAGLGSAAVSLGGGLSVGALMAVNAFGDVVDPLTGAILAGARKLRAEERADTQEVMRGFIGKAALSFASSTVIGVVVTNARLTKEEANKVAQMAHDGIARAVRPAHTMFDGDTLFALATGAKRADVNLIGAFAAETVSQAVVRGVKAAYSGWRPTGLSRSLGLCVNRLAVAAGVCCLLLTACESPVLTPTPRRLPTRAPSAAATSTPFDVSAADYYRQGVEHQRSGDAEGALRYLTWAIQRDPGLAEAYVSRSSVHLARGDLTEALRDADVALELEPSAWSNVVRGESLRLMGEYRQASEAYEVALDHDPSLTTEIFSSRWSAARGAGDVGLIRALGDEYAAAHSDDPLRHYYLGWAALESGVPNKAVRLLVDGMGQTARPPALLWFVLGRAYYEIEAWPEATTSLEAARALVEAGDLSLARHADQPIPLLFVALGEAYLGAGRCADAVSMVEFAISIGASASDHQPVLWEAQICQTPTPAASP